MAEILRDRERNAILNALQRRDELIRDIERAERCGVDCEQQKKRAKAALAYLEAVNHEYITGDRFSL